MPNSARTAYLFQCSGEDLYAVSHDRTGANIPRSSCTQGWQLCGEFQLGRYAPVPAPIPAEPILKGIMNQATTYGVGGAAALTRARPEGNGKPNHHHAEPCT